MKTNQQKVKRYVVIVIIFIFICSTFIAIWISRTPYFTYDYVLRDLKALLYSYEAYGYRQNPRESHSLSGLEDVNLDYTNSVPVIVYHGILDMPNQFGISPKNFKDQMFALKKAGYTSISTEDLYEYLRGEKKLPPKSILITFDDGRVDSFEMADPVLKAVGYKATMFVIARYTLQEERQQYYLSKDQLKEMSASGRWDIEAHSYDGHSSYFTAPGVQDGHFFSHKQWLNSFKRLETDQEFTDRIRTDLEKVKVGLATLLDRPVESFAYPYGDFGQNNTNFKNAKIINMNVAKDIYKLNFYQIDPTQRFNSNYFLEDERGNNSFYVVRIIVDSNWTGRDLLGTLEKATAKRLPYADDFKVNRGWLSFWGNMKIGNNEFSLAAQNDETGGTAILDGSRLWKNYSVSAEVNSPNKSSVYIWVRFQNDNNNLACNFENGFIHIEQTIDGKTRVIQGKIADELKFPDGNFQVEARVKDRSVQCILNDNQVVESNFIEPKLSTGGVGIKTWLQTPSRANLIVKKISVNEI